MILAKHYNYSLPCVFQSIQINTGLRILPSIPLCGRVMYTALLILLFKCTAQSILNTWAAVHLLSCKERCVANKSELRNELLMFWFDNFPLVHIKDLISDPILCCNDVPA